MTKEYRRIELGERLERLPFIPFTPNLGRAEFQICSKYKRGKLVELFIYPQQQENIDYYYHWQGKANGLILSGKPRAWYFEYCKEHKCQTMMVYVPDDSNYLLLNALSDVVIGFSKNERDANNII